MNKDPKVAGQQGVYSQEGDMKANALYQDNKAQIFGRPSLDKVKNGLLIQEKKNFDLGIWSSAGLDDS